MKVRLCRLCELRAGEVQMGPGFLVSGPSKIVFEGKGFCSILGRVACVDFLFVYVVNEIFEMEIINGHDGLFEVHLQKENFKFNAAHFVTFKGFRERLHGHNYRVGIKLVGSKIRNDGYLIDFGDVKKSCRKCCKVLNEHVLIPMKSDVMDIQVGESNVEIRCQVDDCRFLFPKDDCVFLPIVHSTAEELSVFFWNTILTDIGVQFIRDRGITSMEISVAEDLNQAALFRHNIPDVNEVDFTTLDITNFIANNHVSSPKPCFNQQHASSDTSFLSNDVVSLINEIKNLHHSDGCGCCKLLKGSLFQKLDTIAKSMK